MFTKKKIIILQQKIDIKKNYKIIYLFYNLYGLSYKNLLNILIKMGLNKDTSLKNLNDNKFNIIVNFLNYYGILKTNICLQEDNFIIIYHKVNNYRSKRHRRGLPVRGQRTWSNAMNSRSLIFHKRLVNILKRENLINIDL